MIMTDRQRFKVTIVALYEEPKHYIVELKEPGIKPKQYACGPNNSIGNLIARLCREMEGE